MKRLISSLIFLLVCAGMLSAQTTLKGRVTDNAGNPLPGVSVVVQGTTAGTYTENDGTFSLTVSSANRKNAVLEFVYLGFKTERVPVSEKTTINVILSEDAAKLDEVVVVGYGTQKRASVTGSVSQISGKELLKAPVGNVTNLLGGRITGVTTLQQSGQPGADAASIIVRGSGAKYIVDGVQRSFAELDPNEIETISVLKDASSAAVYGLDANAVIIITTKRGTIKDSKISYSGSYGVSSNAVMLQLLDGPGYAYWYNKAREMDGDTPVFTEEHVQKMLNNDPSDGWGNTNWYKETFGVGTSMSHNINSSGGTDKIKYFTSVGVYDQEGNVRGFTYRRYNVRSNIDAKINQNLSLTFDLSARMENRQTPGYGSNPADWNNIPQQAMRAHPYVPMYIDGIPVSTRTASSYVSPIAASDLTGYKKSKTTELQSNFTLKYDVPGVKGLNIKFLSAYDMEYYTSKAFSTPYMTYVATAPTATTTNITYSLVTDARGTTTSLVEGLSHSSDITTNTSINYANKFGKHSVAGILLAETYQGDGNSFGAYGYGFDFYELDELDFAKMADKNNVSGSSSQSRKAGFLARFNYDYDDKYLAEISCRYDGSYLFGGMVPGKRWSPFPAASAGWRMSSEEWFKRALPFVNNFKLRASIGLTGTSGISPYQYLNTLSILENAAVIGGTVVNGLITSNPANINLTWAKSLQYNAGFETTLWDGLLSAEFDVFYKYMYDILSSVSATYPDSFGGFYYSSENKNKQDHKGFEFSLNHSYKIGDFRYSVGFNGSYTKRRWLRYTDSENTPDYLKLTGKEVGAQVGFIATGLFQSEEEIANSALIPGKAVRVGDIKYVDRNGDGKITYEQDRGYIGKSAYPKFLAGMTLNGEWRGVDFNMLFQAGFGRDVALTGVYSSGVMDNTSMTRPFYHGGNSPVYLVEKSWREDNTNAEFPRLSLVPASSNNAYSSTYWYRNGDYLRLKSAQIGYTLPARWVKKAGIDKLRIYTEGQNIFTISQLTKYNIDPEQPGVSNGYYPQQRVISMGINLTF
jgi:TonB-linked SusC/RagA family outer membrane protein